MLYKRLALIAPGRVNCVSRSLPGSKHAIFFRERGVEDAWLVASCLMPHSSCMYFLRVLDGIVPQVSKVIDVCCTGSRAPLVLFM